MKNNVFRILKKQIKKLTIAIASPPVIFFAIIGNGILFLIAFLIFLIEKDINPGLSSFFSALYWGITTMTTVGYGDVVPLTVAGKILAIMLMISGTALFVGFAGILVSYLIKEEVEEELEPIEEEIEEEEETQLNIENKLNDIIARLDKIEKN